MFSFLLLFCCKQNKHRKEIKWFIRHKKRSNIQTKIFFYNFVYKAHAHIHSPLNLTIWSVQFHLAQSKKCTPVTRYEAFGSVFVSAWYSRRFNLNIVIGLRSSSHSNCIIHLLSQFVSQDIFNQSISCTSKCVQVNECECSTQMLKYNISRYFEFVHHCDAHFKDTAELQFAQTNTARDWISC